MKLKKAVKILDNYNKWRRGGDDVGFPDFERVEDALDIVIDAVTKTILYRQEEDPKVCSYEEWLARGFAEGEIDLS